MQTLDEAAFKIAIELLEIGAREGRLPNVTGIDVNVEPIGDGTVSVWLLLDNEDANDHLGHIPINLPDSLVDGVDRDFLLGVLRGWRPSVSLTSEIASALLLCGVDA